MKTPFFLTLSILFFTPIVALSQVNTDSTSNTAIDFSLRIQGINKAEGEIRIAMFNSEQSFRKEPLYAVVLPVGSTVIEWKIEGVPFGEYAIAVFHDRNENGKLDTNILGVPKERYGFSNDARGTFGPASWKDATFRMDSNTDSIIINIK